MLKDEREAFAETLGGPPEKDRFLAKLIAAGAFLAIILALAAYGALHLMGAI